MARRSKSKRVPKPGELVKLRPTRRDYERNSQLKQTNYAEAAPFFANPRGVLAHRVRSITKLDFGERYHYVVEYYCLGTSCHERLLDEGLVHDPGKRLVCAHCERIALEHELPSSSDLAGRHVCTGICRPVNVCPQHKDQNESN